MNEVDINFVRLYKSEIVFRYIYIYLIYTSVYTKHNQYRLSTKKCIVIVKDIVECTLQKKF